MEVYSAEEETISGFGYTDNTFVFGLFVRFTANMKNIKYHPPYHLNHADSFGRLKIFNLVSRWDDM